MDILFVTGAIGGLFRILDELAAAFIRCVEPLLVIDDDEEPARCTGALNAAATPFLCGGGNCCGCIGMSLSALSLHLMGLLSSDIRLFVANARCLRSPSTRGRAAT